MPEFKPITLSDKDEIEHYLSINKYPNSEYSFGSLYAWQKTYNTQYAIIGKCLCMIYESEGKQYAYFPLGRREDFKNGYYGLVEYFDCMGKDFSFSSLSEPMIQVLRENGLENDFENEPCRDFFDYVYTREKLVTLSGKKLNGKRNHYNYFVNNYTFEMRDIDHTNEHDCEEKFAEYILGRSQDAENELEATLKILHDRDALGLSGRTLYANGELVGIILGGKHNEDGLLHIAKADVDCRGASVALFKHYLEDHLTDCEYINLMEDMGIEGLRKSKLAFRPDYYVEKYRYKPVHSYMMACGCRK